MRPKYRHLLLAAILAIPLLPAFGSTIPWECEKNTNPKISVCNIHIDRNVAIGEYLFIQNISDIDQLYAGDSLIGFTGYFSHPSLERRFYSQFLPRLYSLDALANQNVTTLKLKSEAVLSDTVGLSKDNSIVKITTLEDGISSYISAVWKPFILFILPLLFFAILSSKVVFSEKQNGKLPQFLMLFSILSAMFFTLSMSRVPRIAIPLLMDGATYFRIHAFFSISLIFSLSMIAVLSKRVQYPKEGDLISSKILLFSYFISLLCISGFLEGTFRITLTNAYRAAFGIISFSTLLLLRDCGPLLKGFSGRLELPPEIFFRFMLLSFPLVCLRDAYVFYFFHQSGTLYWLHPFGLTFLGLAAMSTKLNFHILRKSEQIGSNIRLALAKAPSANERGLAFMSRLKEEFGANNVEILITDIQGVTRLLGSRNDFHSDIQAAILSEFSRKRLSHVGVCKSQKKNELWLGKYKKQTLPILPIIFDEKVIGAVALVMANSDSNPFRLRLHLNYIRNLADVLKLEILSLFNETKADEKSRELGNILKLTSGIITEYLGADGRFSADGVTTRRIVVSADLIESTRAAKRATNLSRFSLLFEKALDSVYDQWLKTRDFHGFISRDPRGDDFWALSRDVSNVSEADSNAILLNGIELGLSIDSIASGVFSEPRFRFLDIPGARTIVSIGSLKLRIRGSGEFRSVDAYSNELSVISKLRRLSTPGSVVIAVFENQESAINSLENISGDRFIFSKIPIPPEITHELAMEPLLFRVAVRYAVKSEMPETLKVRSA